MLRGDLGDDRVRPHLAALGASGELTALVNAIERRGSLGPGELRALVFEVGGARAARRSVARACSRGPASAWPGASMISSRWSITRRSWGPGRRRARKGRDSRRFALGGGPHLRRGTAI